MRRNEGELSPEEFGRALEELREPDELSAAVIRYGVPDGFGPVPALQDDQRHRELDSIEAGLRKTFLERYGGRHVVVNRFVVLHVTHELAAHAVRSAALGVVRLADLGAAGALHAGRARVRDVAAQARPDPRGQRAALRHRAQHGGRRRDQRAAAWQQRLRAVYGEMITTEDAITSQVTSPQWSVTVFARGPCLTTIPASDRFQCLGIKPGGVAGAVDQNARQGVVDRCAGGAGDVVPGGGRGARAVVDAAWPDQDL